MVGKMDVVLGNRDAAMSDVAYSVILPEH